MKHIFIINPYTGKKKKRDAMLDRIRAAAEAAGIDWEIYYTSRIRAAEDFVRERAAGGEHIRFYACGGDGTLNEAANGAFGYENVEIATIPAGTGNDFVRNFSPAEAFCDIGRQIRGSAHEFDMIKYNDRFCVNMINIGFDCSVVELVEKLRRFPLLNGSKAYTICAFLKMITMPRCSLSFDGADEKRFTLCAVGNGRYCGGGFCSNPRALLDDGRLDVFTAGAKVGRLGFLNMVGDYRAGTLLDDPKKSRHMGYFQAETLRLSAEKAFSLCVDGEVQKAAELALSVCRHALRFVLPEGVTLASV